MISRRNIREKVMQSLYSIASMLEDGETLNSVSSTVSNKILQKKISDASRNFAASLLYIVRIAQYSEIDAGNKASKYRPTEEDLNVSTKIAGNHYLWQLLENETFRNVVEDEQLNTLINDEWVKKMYNKMLNSEKYAKYIENSERNDEEDKKMLIYIWKTLVSKDENFQDILSDEWTGYAEDKVLNRTIIDFYFKNPVDFNFYNFLSKEKHQYAVDLLNAVIDKEAYLMELITPKLNNWDPERIAVIDMILIKMGVSEFLYFDTIPTKVTINEFIEIAKDFSTEESGKFVNAVLDNVLRDLMKNNVVTKS